MALVSLGDWDAAERLLRDDPRLLGPGSGALHLMAKRGDVGAARWLISHGADPSGRWAHWDSEVTPLHLGVLGNHPDIVRMLLDAGADPALRDSKHQSDALGWAEFFQRAGIVRMLKEPR
jgi:ankyrin repeat protein